MSKLGIATCAMLMAVCFRRFASGNRRWYPGTTSTTDTPYTTTAHSPAQTTTTTIDQQLVALSSRIASGVRYNRRTGYVSALLLAVGCMFICLYAASSFLPRLYAGCADPSLTVHEHPTPSPTSTDERAVAAIVGCTAEYRTALQVGGDTGTSEQPALLCERLPRAYRPLGERERVDMKTVSHSTFLKTACEHTYREKGGVTFSIRSTTSDVSELDGRLWQFKS